MQAVRATAMEHCLWHNDIKFMDYAEYVKRVSQQITKAAARQIARERGIQEASFERRRTIMVRRKRPCHVLYQYQIHPQVRWLYAR
jgi:radical SAM superfamily enzyme